MWHRVRDGTMTRAELQLATRPVRRQKILALLEEGEGLSIAKVSGMCCEMLKLQPALFTFIDVEGVDPTNNTAERVIRFAVLMRKGLLRQRQRQGQPLRRTVPHRTPGAAHAEARPLRIPQGRVCGRTSWHSDSVASTRVSANWLAYRSRRVNGYAPTSVTTFPWRRETPGYASKRSTYWNL